MRGRFGPGWPQGQLDYTAVLSFFILLPKFSSLFFAEAILIFVLDFSLVLPSLTSLDFSLSQMISFFSWLYVLPVF